MFKIEINKYHVKKSEDPTEPEERKVYGPVFGIEFTWTRGPGVGVGLGLTDVWFGWPRKQENLHYAGCGHNPFGKTA